MAEQRKYRKFTASQKLEIVLAGVRGEVQGRHLSGYPDKEYLSGYPNIATMSGNADRPS